MYIFAMSVSVSYTHLDVYKRQMLMSGGVVNTERAAIAVVDEFRSAKLGKITLEQVRESV